jgi:hypothetical protein
MQTTEAINKFLNSFGGDGHSIIKSEAVLEMGFTEDFVAPHAYPHQSGSDYKSTIYDKEGNPMRSMYGVYALEFAYAIANDIGADTEPAHSKMGRGFQAGELMIAIKARMEEL